MNTRTYSLLLASALALPAAAQTIDHAKQLFDRAKFAEAKNEFLAVQKVNDRSAAAAYYLGRLATFDNDGGEAIRQLEIAVKFDDRNALYHYWLGSAVRDEAPRASMFSQLSMVKHMRDEFLRAVELDANQLDARLGLVQFYAGTPEVVGGSMDKAREQLADLAKRDAFKGAMARATIASVAKDTAAEVAAYQQAIVSAPDSSLGYFALVYIANAHYWTGRIAERRGAKDAARAQYATALKLNPKYAAAQKALDALNK